MRNAIRFCAFAIFAGSAAAYAYEENNHEGLSSLAARQSVLVTDPAVLRDLGLKPYDDAQQMFPALLGPTLSVEEWIRYGSRAEDAGARPLNHFYNPFTGVSLGSSSPDWAIDGFGDFGTKYSFRAGREYQYLALTSPSELLRARNFGQMFRAVGQVVHHIQDMAQPQHVRSDYHCKLDVCRLMGQYNPSLYEFWTSENIDVIGLLEELQQPYAPVYGADTTTFNSPRKFWNTEAVGTVTDQGKGMAEFSNRNFVTAGTNFDRRPPAQNYVSPVFDANNWTDLTVAQLCANPQGVPCPSSMTQRPNATITFYGTTGRDNLTGAAISNDRASTKSIFDQHLVARGQLPAFALNRFNFQAGYPILFPRAVGYSAGMINYFFRGKMDYVPDPGNPRVKRVKNLGTERMTGTLRFYFDQNSPEMRRAITSVSVDLPPGGEQVVDLQDPPRVIQKEWRKYTMAFLGTLGQEVGTAVIGKVVQLPQDDLLPITVGNWTFAADGNCMTGGSPEAANQAWIPFHDAYYDNLGFPPEAHLVAGVCYPASPRFQPINQFNAGFCGFPTTYFDRRFLVEYAFCIDESLAPGRFGGAQPQFARLYSCEPGRGASIRDDGTLGCL